MTRPRPRPRVVRTRRKFFVAVVMSLVIVGSTVATLAIGLRQSTPAAADRSGPAIR